MAPVAGLIADLPGLAHHRADCSETSTGAALRGASGRQWAEAEEAER
jgi:hypothetical protein